MSGAWQISASRTTLRQLSLDLFKSFPNGVGFAVLVGGVLICASGCPGPGSVPEVDPSLVGCDWPAGETGEESGAGLEALAESAAFQEYLDEHVVSGPGGHWLIEGDIPVHDYELVVESYRRYAEAQRTQGELGSDEGFRATVKCDEDLRIDQIWNPSDKLNLTYCLDTSWDDVRGLRAQVIDALDRGTLAWESAADINFIATANGDACSHATSKFVVTYRGTECLYWFGIPFCNVRGQAFFPNDPEEQRVLNLWLYAFQGPGTLDRVVLHELGHILGLWHEHARFSPQAEICAASDIEEGEARGVTDPDSDSVMGYPHCAGTNPLPPHPSALDRSTVAFLYNLPRPLLGGALAPDDASTLAWHRPSQGEFVVWEPNVAPGQPIQFDETTGCYTQDCSAGDAPWWKPVLYRNDDSVDVLMYGPGDFEEVRFTGLGSALSSTTPGSVTSSVDVPVLFDRFFDDSDRSIWWIRPSYPSDLLWRGLDGVVTSTNDHDDESFTDEHFAVVLGKLALGQSSALWVSPTSNLAHFTYVVNGQVQQFAIDKTQCGLDEGVTYNVIPGDYDGDSSDELVWYDFDSEVVTVWPSLTNCVGALEYDVGKIKPAAIRLTGQEQRDRLMAYDSEGGTVRFYDAMTGVPSAPQWVGLDASPVLRDFDNDGCTDILWFSPHLPSSPLWQSRCNGAGTFVVASVMHPASAYPLGFGLGHGRP